MEQRAQNGLPEAFPLARAALLASTFSQLPWAEFLLPHVHGGAGQLTAAAAGVFTAASVSCDSKRCTGCSSTVCAHTQLHVALAVTGMGLSHSSGKFSYPFTTFLP